MRDLLNKYNINDQYNFNYGTNDKIVCDEKYYKLIKSAFRT